LNFDLFPTCLELAGLEPSREIDAMSLVPLLKRTPMPPARDLYFVRREGGPQYLGKSYEALIRGDWKLMQNNPFSPLELYNLKDDPYETQNVAAGHRQKVLELSAALRAHIQRGGATPWQPPQSNQSR
jgi:arylsulfatase A-like enzyme